MEWTTAVTIAVGVSGAVLGWIVATRNVRKDIAQDAALEAGTRSELKTDVEYIKRGVDDIRVDVRMQGQRVDGLAERVTRVEESSKQSHLRIDRLESGGK